MSEQQRHQLRKLRLEIQLEHAIAFKWLIWGTWFLLGLVIGKLL